MGGGWVKVVESELMGTEGSGRVEFVVAWGVDVVDLEELALEGMWRVDGIGVVCEATRGVQGIGSGMIEGRGTGRGRSWAGFAMRRRGVAPKRVYFGVEWSGLGVRRCVSDGE